MDVTGGRPTTALRGVGTRIAERLAGLGITTVRELAEMSRMSEEALVREFGPATGPYPAELRPGEGRPCVRVHLKMRFAPFFTVTRVHKLP